MCWYLYRRDEKRGGVSAKHLLAQTLYRKVSRNSKFRLISEHMLPSIPCRSSWIFSRFFPLEERRMSESCRYSKEFFNREVFFCLTWIEKSALEHVSREVFSSLSKRFGNYRKEFKSLVIPLSQRVRNLIIELHFAGIDILPSPSTHSLFQTQAFSRACTRAPFLSVCIRGLGYMCVHFEYQSDAKICPPPLASSMVFRLGKQQMSTLQPLLNQPQKFWEGNGHTAFDDEFETEWSAS